MPQPKTQSGNNSAQPPCKQRYKKCFCTCTYTLNSIHHCQKKQQTKEISALTALRFFVFQCIRNNHNKHKYKIRNKSNIQKHRHHQHSHHVTKCKIATYKAQRKPELICLDTQAQCGTGQKYRCPVPLRLKKHPGRHRL